HAHPYVLGEVLARQMVELVLVPVADLPGLAGLANLVDGLVQALQQRRHPRAPGLRDHELETREAPEYPAEYELDEGPLGVEADLVDVEEHGEGVVAVVGRTGTPVDV